MQIKSVKVNAVLNIIYTITNMIFPLITYPYVTRVLSSVGMGKVSFFSSIASYATMIASLGISTYGIRAVARARDDKNELAKVSSELLTLNMINTAIVVAVLLILIPFVKRLNSEPILFAINLIVIIATPFGIDWFYSGLEQYSYITKRNVALKALSLVLVFLCIKKRNDYTKYALISAISSVSAFVCNFTYARHFTRFHFSKQLELKKHLKPMLLLFASILAVSVYTNLDTIMLGFINGDREVGLYSVATKVEWLLLTAVNAVSAVLLPRLSNYVGNKEYEKFNHILKNSISFVFTITIPLTLYFILEADDAIYFLGGADYSGAVLCMQFLMPILVISGFSNVTGNQILLPRGEDSSFMKAVVFGAITDLVLNIVLMPRFGCTGAAFATLVAEFAQMSVQVNYTKDVIKNNLSKENLLKAVISGFFAFAIVYIIKNFLMINSFIRLVLTAIVFFSAYAIVLIATKDSFALSMLQSFTNSIKKK